MAQLERVFKDAQVPAADPFPYWTEQETSQGEMLCGVRLPSMKASGRDGRCYLPYRACREHAEHRPRDWQGRRDVELYRNPRLVDLVKCPTCKGAGTDPEGPECDCCSELCPRCDGAANFYADDEGRSCILVGGGGPDA